MSLASNISDVVTQIGAKIKALTGRVSALEAGGSTGSAPFVATIGDGATTPIVVTHNLGTRNIEIVLRAHATPYDRQYCRWEATDANTATLYFDAAPASNALDVLVSTLAQGPKGDKGDTGTAGGIQSIVAGTNVTVDNTDPDNPIVSATGGGGSGAGTGLVGSRIVTADYTLVADDNGREIQVDSPNLTAIVCDPTGLPVPFECSVRPVSSGAVRFTERDRPVDGDLLLFLIFSDGTATPGAVGTSAFTGTTATPKAVRFQCCWKIANSATDTYPFNAACSNAYSALCLAIRGAHATTPVEASLVTSQASFAASPAAINATQITTLSNNALVLGFASLVTSAGMQRAALNVTSPAGFRAITRMVPPAGGDTNLFVASKVQAVAGATGAFTPSIAYALNGGGGVGGLSGLLAIKPAGNDAPRIVGIGEQSCEQSASNWFVPVPDGATLVGDTLQVIPNRATRVRSLDGSTFMLDGGVA